MSKKLSSTSFMSYKSLVTHYVDLASNHTIKVLGFFGAISLLMFYFASHLSIQTDLRVLLPNGTPSVIALEESERRMGSTDFYTIAFEDSSAERVGRFQKEIADSLSRWPEASYVQFDQDPSFFEKHALLYFPVEQLEDLRDRLKGMIQKGKDKANPILVDLIGDDEAKPRNLDGWPDAQALYREGLPMDVVSTLLEKIEAGKGVQKDSNVVVVDSTAPALPDSLHSRLMGFNEQKGVWVGVVMARLNQPSTLAAFASKMKNRGEVVIRSVCGSQHYNMVAKVVGAYRDPSAEIDQVSGDTWLSGTIAIGLIILLLAFYMHRPANVVVVFVPLTAAMVWMMGSADLIFGRLTVLTSFVIALLSGLGIEYNIHIYSRWIEERRKGHNIHEAMKVSLLRTGRSLISAMVASVVCMLALQIGHFQGFKEFGIVISLGIFFAFLSAMLLLPPLLFALLRFAAWVRHHRGKRYDWFLPSADVAAGAQLIPLFRLSPRFVRTSFAIAMAFTVLLAFSPHVNFENDFKNLRGASTGSGIRYGKAVGKGQDAHPSIILGNSEEQMREIHTQLGTRFGSPADSMLESFVTVASFVPSPEDQDDRMDVLDEVREILDGPDMQKADKASRDKADALRKYLEPEEFTFEDLPDYAKRFLTEADGSHSKFGYIYSKFRESDANEGRKFQDRFQRFDTQDGKVAVASTGFIYADVVSMVKADSGKLAIFVFLFLAIVIILDTRSWRGVLVNLGYIGLISLWTYWTMGWLGWKLGMFNIVVIPALLSNTVDATIHLFHRRMEMGAGKLGEIYHTAGSSVLAGTLTNAFGFTALCFVSHQGLRTIGLLASLGYVSGILIMFFVMPYLLEVICPKEPQKMHGDED